MTVTNDDSPGGKLQCYVIVFYYSISVIKTTIIRLSQYHNYTVEHAGILLEDSNCV